VLNYENGQDARIVEGPGTEGKRPGRELAGREYHVGMSHSAFPGATWEQATDIDGLVGFDWFPPLWGLRFSSQTRP